jgi:Icc protein
MFSESVRAAWNAAGGSASACLQDSRDSMTLAKPYFIQISDMHLFADPQAQMWGVAPDPTLDRTLDMLLREAPEPDFVLVTGDCSSDGSAESYVRLQAKLQRLAAPLHYLPGNHDDPALFARLLMGSALPADGKLKQVFETCGWRFVLLDSVVAGTDIGRIGPPQYRWLRETLQARSSLPTVIAVHHNPLPVGSAWLDTMTIEDGAELLHIVDACAQVRLVLFGHVHQEFESVRNHAGYLSAPSTFFQFKPASPVFAQDAERGAGARVVGLRGGAAESKVLRINEPVSAKAYRR